MEINKYTVRGPNIQKEEAIDLAVLEAILFDYSGSATEAVYETEEFTFIYPWTGLPDYTRLVIRYTPFCFLVKLKSLKYYLISYQNVGILQEHAVNRILRDLVQLLESISVAVEADCKVRGFRVYRSVTRTSDPAMKRISVRTYAENMELNFDTITI